LDDKLVDDRILALRIKNDNIEAFELLYHRYKKKLYYFSFRCLRNSIEAEELVQTVFINIWEHRKTLDETKSFKSYIYRITVNSLYNVLKKRAVRGRFSELELQKHEEFVNETYEQIFYKDLEKRINTIVNSLPEQQRKIYNLSRQQGFSVEEISGMIDISIRTVENQIYRVTKLIKEHLRSEMFS